MNGVEPFAWVEYEAESPPYVIGEWWAAMSGLEYEVRAASVSVDGQSAWSDSVAVTAPELLSAPASAIIIRTPRPYAVGERTSVDLQNQRPLTRRSSYAWSACDLDGSDCELLSSPSFRGSYDLLIPEAARGKVLRVQVDYDRGGASYTAAVALGVVDGETPPAIRLAPALPSGCGGAPNSSSGADAPAPDAVIATHLHLLESHSAPVAWDSLDNGGAIEPLCNDLLVAGPWGTFALARWGGNAERIDGRVPMNLEGLESYWGGLSDIQATFRVADILLRERSGGVWDLFVTHHYFTGECVRFRLSSTTVVLESGDFSVSPSWRTLFDAEPCLHPNGHDGQHAGGKMLTDGPDHLLIVVGDHDKGELAQDPDSHFGKLLRVEIETGKTETLASGFRNPQGFARDATGNLWETEHGPDGGDELNLLEPGANYGWPSASYGVEYGGYAIGADAADGHAGFAPPAFAWVPSIGVSSVIVNDERAFPLWGDDLLAASLTARGNGNSLFRIRRDGTEVRYVERIEVGYRIRDLAQTPDGRLALLNDEGSVHFLSRSAAYCDEWARRLGLVYAAGCGSAGADLTDPEG